MIKDAWFDLASADPDHGAAQIHNTGAVALTSFHGLGLPEPRADRFNRPRTHGIYDRTTYYGARVFELEGICIGDDVEEALDVLDTLKQLFALTGYQKRLWIQREGRAYREYCDVVAGSAMVADFDIPVRVLPWSIQLVAADPRLYEEDLDTASFAATASVTNAGNFNTPPVIRINGAGTDGGIQNNSLSTENVLRIDAVLGGGDVVEIDVAERTVKLNGTLAPQLLDQSASSFFKLVAGTNNLVKVGGAVSIEVDWHNARI